MGDDKDEGARTMERKRLADQLAKETGITEAQAADLIKMLGTDRNSLLREARVIYSRRLR
jgi:nucleoid DNA-binding protein